MEIIAFSSSFYQNLCVVFLQLVIDGTDISPKCPLRDLKMSGEFGRGGDTPCVPENISEVRLSVSFETWQNSPFPYSIEYTQKLYSTS